MLPSPVASPGSVLTPVETQVLQNRSEAAAEVVIVMGCDSRHPGKLVARPHRGGHDGGRFLACVPVVDTLATLRAHMPSQVKRRGVLTFSVPAPRSSHVECKIMCLRAC